MPGLLSSGSKFNVATNTPACNPATSIYLLLPKFMSGEWSPGLSELMLNSYSGNILLPYYFINDNPIVSKALRSFGKEPGPIP